MKLWVHKQFLLVLILCHFEMVSLYICISESMMEKIVIFKYKSMKFFIKVKRSCISHDAKIE